jgi:hypothetical protein
MFHLSRSLIPLIAIIVLCAVETQAQPSFTINNVQGTAYLTTSVDGGPPILRRPLEFHFAGPRLSISSFSPFAFGGDPGNVEARDTCLATPCAPGTLVGTNSSFSGVLAAGGATAVVNGVRYEFVTLTGSLNFVSAPIVLPNFLLLARSEVKLPFSFSGNVTGVSSLTPIFDATLSGQGIATFRFELVGFDVINPRFRLLEIEYVFGPLPISIDIKPGTFPNRINPRSKGKITVAILSTDTFDATTVDPSTVLFGVTGDEVAPFQSVLADVDGDGKLDLLLHFTTQGTGITCGTDSASLTGSTFSGQNFEGADSIITVGCK